MRRSEGSSYRLLPKPCRFVQKNGAPLVDRAALPKDVGRFAMIKHTRMWLNRPRPDNRLVISATCIPTVYEFALFGLRAEVG